MYDWEAVIDGTLRSDLEYVPLLHSNQQWCTEGWEQNVANARAKYNVQNILSFNEPDQVGGGGSGMPVDQAIAAHKKFIDQPLRGKGLKIGSPSVTNADEPNTGHQLPQAIYGRLQRLPDRLRRRPLLCLGQGR
ncbi:hypothetical protein SNOG_04743 [Parastagonospora nodorum SN15]|uniref:Asl1-like glycosyl hydrolase catalytic domain-containing protein n=1 Tax=Phaeosphaeria nodorum (strain SN15 / ATCC MYA-4574 / FGSC 10173) TaxID=321614 RepID=Q0UU21_PHANO|nr:hypothetical protein SNOG_04743 [Parastagonospora nodorum SN15]EAT88503.2 hypothetical protein SNOG_04743 [Parastagonospora nodorum SN15]